MQYSVHFNVFASVLLFMLLVRHLIKKRIPTRSEKHFISLLILTFADIGLTIASAFCINNINSVHIYITETLNILFFCVHSLLPACFFIYICSVVIPSYKSISQIYAFLLPCILSIFLSATNCMTNLVFYIDGPMGDYRFNAERGILYLNIIWFFYLAISLVYAIIYKKKYSNDKFSTIISVTVFCSLCLIFQTFSPENVVIGLATAISLLLFSTTVQHPRDLIDRETGAYNHRALKTYLKRIELSKEPQYFLGIKILEIDKIVQIIGNEAKYTYLEDLADFLKRISKNCFVFRVSESGFAVATKSESSYELLCRSITKFANDPWKYNFSSINIELAIRSHKVDSIENSSDLLELLASLSYNSDTEYKHGEIIPIDEKEINKAKRKYIIESEMRQALQNETGFQLYFQPIFNVKENKFTHAEALSRLFLPTLGMVGPGDFIPIAEFTDMIFALDRIVVKLACKFLVQNPDIVKFGIRQIDINLSAKENFKALGNDICNIIDSYGLDHTLFNFEITETATISKTNELNGFMDKMTRLGFSFSLDDFGSGYANLVELGTLPFRTVKLDRSLIQDSQMNRNSAFLQSVLNLLAPISDCVVAEGAETSTQVEILKNLSVDLIQGFYYSKPLPESTFVSFIKTNYLE